MNDEVPQAVVGDVISAPGWWDDLGTWARVSLAGILVAAALALALGVYITRQVERRFLEAEVEATQQILEFLTTTDAIGRNGEPNTPLLTEIVTPGIERGLFERVKLWSPDGTILYSDDPRLVGRSFDLDEDLHGLFEPISHVADLTATENLFERDLGDALLETYIPVTGEGGVVAVWEVYRQLDTFNEAVGSVRRMVFLTVGGGLLLLGIALVSAFGALIASAQRRRHEAERRSVDLEHLLDLARSATLHHRADELVAAATAQLEKRAGIDSVEIVERVAGGASTRDGRHGVAVAISDDGMLELRAVLSGADEEDVEPLLHAAAEEIRIGIQKAALYEDLEANRAQLQSVMNLLVNAQEDERRRLVADIHDGLAQDLYRVLFGIRGCMTADAGSVAAELEDLELLVADSSRRLRQLLQTIHPSVIEDLGLGSSLRTLAEQIEQRYGMPVRGDIEDMADVPVEVSMAAYRVAQEALVNAAKHASATSATISARADGDLVVVEVSDDGGGFVDDASPGLGLWLMRDRVARWGGSLDIDSGDSGTRVSIKLPAAGRSQ